MFKYKVVYGEFDNYNFASFSCLKDAQKFADSLDYDFVEIYSA